MSRAIALAVLWCSAGGAALAFPEGPPWGHTGAPGQENCTFCHFDNPPRHASPALTVDGLPPTVTPGATYTLTFVLWDKMARAGIQAIITDDNGHALGTWRALEGRVEAAPEGVRSTLAGSTPLGIDNTRWSVEWTAPPKLDRPVTLWLAANAGNADASPFGDSIHLQSYRLPPAP